MILFQFFFLSCRRRHTRWPRDWSSDVCSSDLSGLAVGIVTALQFVPMLFLSPLAGLLADRLPRRKLLIFTQSSLGVLAAGLGALVVFDVAHLWHVYIFAGLLCMVTAFVIS